MDLLGSAVDANGPQIFLLTDASRAQAWRGGTNGEGDLAIGSDWAHAYEAFYGAPPSDEGADEGDDVKAGTRVVEAEGTRVDLVDFGSTGWALVYRVDDRIVLVDGIFEEEEEAESACGEDENVSTSEAYVAWVTAPPSDAAVASGVLELPSGWLVAMSSTESWPELNGDMPPSMEQLAAVEDEVFQLDDTTGGHAIFVRAAARRYRVHVEPEIEAEWGSGARVVLVPA